MKVEHARVCNAEPSATIETGKSSWDDATRSVRLRFEKAGRFDPFSSSEIPPGCLPELVATAIDMGLLKIDDVLRAVYSKGV